MGQSKPLLRVFRESDEASLRKIASATSKMIPIIQGMLGRETPELAPTVMVHLEAWLAIEHRVLSLTLYTLSNLPEDPEEKAGTVVEVLRSCADLRRLAEVSNGACLPQPSPLH